MSPKVKRRTLQFFGFIIGLVFGYFRPSQMQNLLPVLAIGVGIGYFIYSSSLSKEDDNVKETAWFPLVQMVMYFLIGGVLSSSILLALEMRIMQ
ncbi:hypothetical protein SAMN04488102_11014 [Alkalibacterium subtropicum]|uniref:Uncharacterized protein n=1 Tax=Alkalibacterium subtropicum TaxID=753702 RepID=A0A1I1K2E6_9LACT|nr:hypothetical protein [Alkalibacterium subtropicum]SFC54681.1 hypothetical protein SAMN04488102_11014 [Alkalibacterium subtropicum]